MASPAEATPPEQTLAAVAKYIDKNGAARAALAVAAERGDYLLCLWLLLAGHAEDVDRRHPTSGDTALLAACSGARDARLVRLLLSFGADARATDADATTPLHRALAARAPAARAVARALFAAGAPLESRDAQGRISDGAVRARPGLSHPLLAPPPTHICLDRCSTWPNSCSPHCRPKSRSSHSTSTSTSKSNRRRRSSLRSRQRLSRRRRRRRYPTTATCLLCGPAQASPHRAPEAAAVSGRGDWSVVA